MFFRGEAALGKQEHDAQMLQVLQKGRKKKWIARDKKSVWVKA